MTLSTREVIDIVFNDEKYVRHVNPDSFGQNGNWTMIEIPRSSFTAFRLSYASPIELSVSSKVVLLGGIPSQWYQRQSRTVKTGLSKLKNSTASEKIGNERSKSFRTIYHEDGPADERQLKESNRDINSSHDDRESSADSAGRSPKVLRHPSTSMANRISKLENKAQTLPFLPTIDPYRTPFLSKRPSLAREGHTVGHLPSLAIESTTGLRNWSMRKGQAHEGSEHTGELEWRGEHKSERDNYDAQGGSSKKAESCSHHRFQECEDREAQKKPLDQLYREQEQNEKEMNRLLNPSNSYCSGMSKDGKSEETYVSAASNVSEIRESGRSPALGTPVTLPYTDPTLCPVENHEFEHSKDNLNKAIKFQLQPPFPIECGLIDKTLEPKKNKPQSRQNSIVYLKELASSKEFRRLSVLLPKPEDYRSQQEENPVKIERIANHKSYTHHLGTVNKKTNGFIANCKRRASKRCNVSFSPRGQTDRLGPILMMDKMLVMVKTAVTQRNPILDFSESEPIDTRVADRWREYIVVARKTNQQDHSILLQFCQHNYKWHNAFHEQGPGYGNTLDFHLDKSCIVGLYSILDKTIFIEKPDDKYFDHSLGELYNMDDHHLSTLKFYILKCSTLMASGKWTNFLRSAVGMKSMPSMVSLGVPEAGVSFSVQLSKNLAGELTNMEMEEKDTLKIACLPRGYRIFQIPIIRYILATVYDKLEDAGFTDVTKGWEKANIVMGVNFRHYDLINWCPGHKNHLLTNIFTLFEPHSLEFRPYAYYDRALTLASGAKILEPTPIEGFLIRLTDQDGSDTDLFGKPHISPAYFFTSESLLFSMGFTESTPPVPLDLLISATESPDSTEIGDHLNEIPELFEQNPYPLNLESHIEWLNGNLDREEFILNDFFAFKCFNRKIVQIIKSKGLVDMTEIEEVYQGSAEEAKSQKLVYRIYSSARKNFWRAEASLLETAESIIFMRNKNGLVLKLMAPNPKICQEWVKRLNQMINYWKKKQNADFQKMWSIKMRNITNLQIEEEEEANINGRTPKWVTDRGVTDPAIYNVNALAVLRPLLHRGLLHQKPKKHAVFKKYMVIMVPGFLILYHSYRRSTTGFAKPSVDHCHYMTVPIENCYVYSGTLTELDLLDRDRDFDELNPGSHSLPRVYNDGWASSETETSRCFTLWFGKKRFLSKSSKNLQLDKDYRNQSARISDLKNEPLGSNANNPNMLKMIRQLGVSGRSMVFMARSRQERDLWVLSLHYEIERIKNVS